VLIGVTVLVLASGWSELVAGVAVAAAPVVGSVAVASPVELPHPERTAAVSVSAQSALDEIGFDIARTLMRDRIADIVLTRRSEAGGALAEQ
jgi:hypothetical protein